MENGNQIKMELLPKAAPNTVNSFLWAARKGVFDGHVIERIVPKDWIDVSYTGFQKREGQYLIPWEYTLNPQITPLDSDFGWVCMGGYGEQGQAGCEFFFPLRPCPEHKGIYPVFGRVLEGREELLRLRSLELEPVTTYPNPEIEVNRPVVPQKIQRVEVELFGQEYPEPVRLEEAELPECWRQVWE
ncbi:MAG: peptidylprolyl isomerase [Lachnospiraceae bacterium]|nr:peptidylprolyl isomerase [Lachnospiraceae bacterium]MCI8997279.1 peptidylprolyl isomerase [Lachnospiraceae bacterium]MCI9135465.1 peptidylprolyl isomerase [Lachnospiraceae bacterium]